MPRAFLVKKKKQRVESIVEELAKQEGLESKPNNSDGESDKKSDEDSSGKTSQLIAEVLSLGEKRREEEQGKEGESENKLRTLEDLIERRLRETLEDTACRSGKSRLIALDGPPQNFQVNGERQIESREQELVFHKDTSKPPPLLRTSPRSAFEKVVSPKYISASSIGPPPPLETRKFHSEFYYPSEMSQLSRTLPRSSPYGLTVSPPRYILTGPRKPLYCEPDEALNLSRRRPKSDSDAEDCAHDNSGTTGDDSPTQSAEYLTKKKYILDRNGRPESIPAMELINESGIPRRSPTIARAANEISPLYASPTKSPYPYSSIFADRPRPEAFLYPKQHSPIERNGYASFEIHRETFVGRASYPIQDAPLNLHQSPKGHTSLLRETREPERQGEYPSDINSNDLAVPSLYQGVQTSESDVKVTVTCDEPGKLHPSKIKINDVTLEQVISIQNTIPVKRNGKTIARQPILGVEYVQNGTDLKLRDMMEKEGGKSHGSEDSNDADLMEEKDSVSEGSIGGMEGEGEEEGSIANGQMMDGRSDDDKPSPNRKYVCDICGKGFSRSNTLVTHKRIHTGDKPFKCEVCGRAFRQPGNLTRHRLTHTTVKPYVCSQCGKAFNRASNLHTHMRTHTNYKPFICQYCGKGFHQKIDMKIHSYTHTGEKPHKCKKCGRGFKQLTHLTYHMRTHSEVKMYTCSYCGKGFNQKGNLQAHIYGHTGERPYKCEICGKGFTLASTLNTHRRTHADKKPFVCKYCGKDFYQKNALKSHLVASHPYTGESLL